MAFNRIACPKTGIYAAILVGDGKEAKITFAQLPSLSVNQINNAVKSVFSGVTLAVRKNISGKLSIAVNVTPAKWLEEMTKEERDAPFKDHIHPHGGSSITGSAKLLLGEIECKAQSPEDF